MRSAMPSELVDSPFQPRRTASKQADDNAAGDENAVDSQEGHGRETLCLEPAGQ